jgi:hypothetical protein
MRRGLSGLWMVINRPPGDEDFGPASSRFEASNCSRHGYLHPELVQLLTSLHLFIR